MPECLLERRPDGVALITLNRPESLNALGGELPGLFAGYLEECEADPAVRCVAVTGSGRAFCAGGDVRGMQARGSGQTDAAGGLPHTVENLATNVRILRSAHHALSLKLHTIAKPTVALVNGHAVGAGLSLALACDIRICATGAKFGTAFRNMGLSGDYGGSYLLQRVVGMGKARELYFTAEVFEAARALELGIANRVVEPERLLDEGLAFCAKLAAGPTLAFGAMKANLNFAATHSLAEVLDHEALAQRLNNLSDDHREAVQAFLGRREPGFVGR